MKRPPFKIVGNTRAVYRRDGKFVTSGRTTFVWETLVMAVASGVQGVHAIRSSDGPWHTITLTVEEAEAALDPHGDFFGRRRVARARKLRAMRERREART